MQDGAWKCMYTIASYIALQLQILLLGTWQEVFLQHVIYFYIKVVLYRVLLIDLGNISIVWPKVAWPDTSPPHKALLLSV